MSVCLSLCLFVILFVCVNYTFIFLSNVTSRIWLEAYIQGARLILSENRTRLKNITFKNRNFRFFQKRMKGLKICVSKLKDASIFHVPCAKFESLTGSIMYKNREKSLTGDVYFAAYVLGTRKDRENLD